MGKLKGSAYRQAGFTLIEILVVVTIFAIFSVALIGILLATIRGGNKAQLTQVLHQEGDYALTNMARVIRRSQVVVCATDQITVTGRDGGVVVFNQVEDETVNKIASNSSQFLTGSKGTVSDLSFTCYENDMGQTTVTIKFTLDSALGTQTHEKFTQNFATSVSLRND